MKNLRLICGECFSVSTTGLVEAEFNGEATVTAKSGSSLVDARYATNTGAMIIPPVEVSQ
jgi:hypothetical protein